MTVAQGTPSLVERLRDMHNRWVDIVREQKWGDQLDGDFDILDEAAAEVAALSAQVVELQQQIARDKVTHDLNLQGKMLEAAAKQVKELQQQLVDSTVTRASVPPSFKEEE